ncbi:MAG: TetR/AcrR family transcriptional regulator, partial [Acidobacteriota bacterium]
MQRDQRSERSRRQVLDAALRLFAHHGYGATTVRAIADEAKVSVGNVYHHFPDKEAIFRTLLDDYWQIAASPRYPFVRSLAAGDFPNNLEQLGSAARDSVRQYPEYMALIYVDVIEFDGTHIRKFYGDMPKRFGALLEEYGLVESIRAQLRPGVSPISALLLATRIFFNYFSLEILFKVP